MGGGCCAGPGRGEMWWLIQSPYVRHLPLLWAQAWGQHNKQGRNELDRGPSSSGRGKGPSVVPGGDREASERSCLNESYLFADNLEDTIRHKK